MTKDERNKKFETLSKKWDECTTRGSTDEEHIQQLADFAAELNFQSYMGWILHAGRVSDGKFQVQFNISGNGYSSRWPEWAFESAKEALLHRKKVWVISDGKPFGGNLLQVLVMNSDI